MPLFPGKFNSMLYTKPMDLCRQQLNRGWHTIQLYAVIKKKVRKVQLRQIISMCGSILVSTFGGASYLADAMRSYMSLIQNTWFLHLCYSFIHRVWKEIVWVITDFHVWCLIMMLFAHDIILEWKHFWNNNDMLSLAALLLITFFFMWGALLLLSFFLHATTDF